MKTKEAADVLFQMAMEKNIYTSEQKDALWLAISLLNDRTVSEGIRYGKF